MGLEEIMQFKVGDKVLIPKSTNEFWVGQGVVDEVFDDGYSVRMLTGKQAGKSGWFEDHKVLLYPELTAKVTGGAPHGFGILLNGDFLRVDLGALGGLIVDKEREIEELKAWKESALKTTLDWQKIGLALELKVGDDVPKLLFEEIRKLKAAASQAKYGVGCACAWENGEVIGICGHHYKYFRELAAVRGIKN
jgi:hypothetical protein